MRCIAPTGTYLHFQCARHTNLVSTGTKMEGLVEFTIIADFKLNSNDLGDEYWLGRVRLPTSTEMSWSESTDFLLSCQNLCIILVYAFLTPRLYVACHGILENEFIDKVYRLKR